MGEQQFMVFMTGGMSHVSMKVAREIALENFRRHLKERGKLITGARIIRSFGKTRKTEPFRGLHRFEIQYSYWNVKVA